MSSRSLLARVVPAGVALVLSIRCFRRADRGLAAVEFALILPLMVTMYLGLVSITMGVNTDRKLTLVSRTVSDLVSRSSATMSNTDLANIIGAATAVFAPYKPDRMNIAIASVYVKDTGQKGAGGAAIVSAKVCWSVARTVSSNGSITGGVLPAGWEKDAVVSQIPDGFNKPNSTYLISQVTQDYTPIIGQAITGTIKLSETTPWPVRNVPEVTLQNEAVCLGT